MNKNEMKSVDEMKSVVQFFDENPQILTNKPALANAVNVLKENVKGIEALTRNQAVSTKADTAIKQQKKELLVKAVFKVQAAISAHAASVGDTRLKMATNKSENELMKMRDTNLRIKVSDVYEMALPLAAELAVWETTQTDIDALNISLEQYAGTTPAIRNIKARTVQATSDVKAKIDETKCFIKDTLDAMMLPFKILQPKVYGEYKNARKVLKSTRGRGFRPTPEAPTPAN